MSNSGKLLRSSKNTSLVFQIIYLHVANKSMHLILNLITLSKWFWLSIDIKSALLQNKNIDRVLYVKPPKEAD